MDARAQIKTLLLKEGMTITELAKKMSCKMKKNISRTGLSNKLGRNSIDYKEISVICEILGYEMKFKKTTN